MSNSTTLTYGSYNFVPVPFMNVTRSFQKNGAEENIGSRLDFTLNGDLVVLPTGSIVAIDALQDQLLSGLATQGQLFLLMCGGAVLFSGYPRIGDVNFPEDNWVNNCKYTVNLTADLPPDSGSHYIESFSENWSLEVADERPAFTWTPSGSVAETLPFTARLSHELNAVGKTVYSGGSLVMPAWQQARNYVMEKLGYDETFAKASGVIGFPTSYWTPYNHFRTVQTGETDGTYSVNESFLLLGQGASGHATENFTISVRENADSPLRNVSIEGQIQGLQSRTYSGASFTVTETPYAAASGYWTGVQGRLIDRANTILDLSFTARNINPIALNKTVGHNVHDGLITYSIEWDTRNTNCLTQADGSPVYSENIVISDQNQVDVFAQIFVLGKSGGPVLQDLDTKTVGSRTLSIETVSLPAQLCPNSISNISSLLTSVKPSNVETIVDAVEDGLEASYGTVFRSEDSSSSDIRNGRYSRNVTWTYSACN